MTRVVVSAETETWTDREADPNDEWDNGDTGGRVANVVAFLEGQEVSYYGDSHGKDIPGADVGITVYAVVVDYESGCTFGRDGGHAQVLDFFSEPSEAKALADVAIARKESDGFGFEHNGVEYFTSWLGYFESLNSIDVWACRIKSAPKDPWSNDPTPGFRVGR